MDQSSEQRPLPSLMVGHQVAVKYISGPDITHDNLDQVVEEGQVLKGQLEARTAAFYLKAYSTFGIEVSKGAERGNEIFIPWGAVLAIWGPSREDLEQTIRDDTEREWSQPAEEVRPPRDRQELMERLSIARTPSEVANARAAADIWLATHPGDGDVRLAREQLRPAYSEEDLEEGSPT